MLNQHRKGVPCARGVSIKDGVALFFNYTEPDLLYNAVLSSFTLSVCLCKCCLVATCVALRWDVTQTVLDEGNRMPSSAKLSVRETQSRVLFARMTMMMMIRNAMGREKVYANGNLYRIEMRRRRRQRIGNCKRDAS